MDPIPQTSQELAMVKPILQASVLHRQPIIRISLESRLYLRACHVSPPSVEIQAEQAGDKLYEVLKELLTLVS